MLIKFFKNGQGGGAGPVDYLIEREVVAYDDNRNALRDSDGNIVMFKREPLPEVLRGDPDQMRHLIDACQHQWSYRAGVLSFTGEDAPTSQQQNVVMDAFEDLAFAGLQPNQRSILWVCHSHEDRIELHFVTPRMELATGRSLNIAPPGYQKTYDALRDVLNKEHGWNDPQAPERAREVKSLIESITRGEGRELIHDWIFSRIETGEIRDRIGIIEHLTRAGFDIPRSGKNYITVLDPESNERWRLKGDIFREDWTRQNTVERTAERTGREPSRSGSRLDAISLEDLRERLHDITERRATYNRERYPVAVEHIPQNEQERSTEIPDFGSDKFDRYSAQLSGELVLGKYDYRQGAERQPLEPRFDDQQYQKRNTAELEREEDQTNRMSYWQRIREMFANLGKGIIDDKTRNLADSTRTRIDDIRRKIDRSLRAIGNSVQGIGRELEEEEPYALQVTHKLAVIGDRITGLFSGGFERIGEQHRERHFEGVEGKPQGQRAGAKSAGDRSLSDSGNGSRRRNSSDHSI